MQFYALDKNKNRIFVKQAKRHTDYYCLECGTHVRRRGGDQRQDHFYHMTSKLQCHLHSKGIIHLQIQRRLMEILPRGESRLEYYFNSIKRIADVAWLAKKIVFEVQCSFITSTEVLERIRDYRKIGWEVIWIFHDSHYYNQRRVTAAEWAVSSFTHYFTNMDEQARGIFYDQFEHIEKGIRQRRLSPLLVNMADPFDLIKCRNGSFNTDINLAKDRLRQWKLSFKGDLIDLNLHDNSHPYLQYCRQIEKILSMSLQNKPRGLKELFYTFLIDPYRSFFHFLLERICRY